MRGFETMTFVETVISQLKHGQNPAKDEIGNKPMGKTLSVDLNALRIAGYMPEAESDRVLANQYRQIKGRLIRNAFPRVTPSIPAAGAVKRSIIMVTSALPGDGKTFTSINLALSMARERDVSVLLVDADVLKPHVSRIFGVDEEQGLTNALVDHSTSAESLILPTNIRGFSILPAGPLVENASELINSERMRQTLDGLCQAEPRRIVLLDSPPLLITAESRTLLGLAGQVVLVVREGVTPRQAMIDAITLFDEKQVGGIVLNDARVAGMQGYYGYGSYGTYGDGNSPKS
jgi:exopolysaccharide/PEP-CTERM locus tyrosine autokinase